MYSGAVLSPQTIPRNASSTILATKPEILRYTKGLTGVNLWLNDITSDVLYGTLGLIFVCIFISRVFSKFSAYIRLLATINASQHEQNYWKTTSQFWSTLKKHLLVAPLIHKRHNKEFQLSSAIGIGTLPSRLHSLFLSFYILSNVLYCCLLDYKNSTRPELLAEARGRVGHLAVMNMLPLFIFSTRNNPLIPILGITFDTFNLFHRWIGRIAVAEALCHTFFWGANDYDAQGLAGLWSRLWHDWFFICGFAAICAFVIISIQTLSPIRHAFYEVFLHLHQLLAVIALTAIALHVSMENLPQKPIIWTLIGIWTTERLSRLYRLFYRRGTVLTVQALEGGASRLTFSIKGTWPTGPGRHIYAYIPAVSLWMSHPFSVAWVNRNNSSFGGLGSEETLTSIRYEDCEAAKSFPKCMSGNITVSCVVAARSGMTGALYRKAKAATRGTITLKAYLEGPYGGQESLRSYGTVLLFAGGVGITHQLGHLHDLVNSFASGTCATRKVVLVWSVRTIEQLNWIKPWLDELLELPRRGNQLKILMYVSRGSPEDKSALKLKDVDDECQVLFGRMKTSDIVDREFSERVGHLNVGVCGPGALADEVRAAARGVMDQGSVDFWEEAFTW